MKRNLSLKVLDIVPSSKAKTSNSSSVFRIRCAWRRPQEFSLKLRKILSLFPGIQKKMSGALQAQSGRSKNQSPLKEKGFIISARSSAEKLARKRRLARKY